MITALGLAHRTCRFLTHLRADTPDLPSSGEVSSPPTLEDLVSLSGLSRPAGIAALPCCRRERSFDAFRRISFTVASVSLACRFHLCACIKSPAGAGPDIRSDVGAGVGFLSHVLPTSGSGVAPRRGLGGPTPSRFLVSCKSFDARSLASCFLRYSDFMPLN